MQPITAETIEIYDDEIISSQVPAGVFVDENPEGKKHIQPPTC